MRRFFLSFIIVFLGFSLVSCGGYKPEKLNVVLITIDTLRADHLSCYDPSHVKTPNIDALAEKGVVFTHAFAHVPMTLPSHTSILTGTLPLYHGVEDNYGFKVSSKLVTLAEFMKKAGYSTAAFIGAFPLDSRFGLNQGFDMYDDSYPAKNKRTFFFPERRANKVVESAISWLEKHGKGRFFIWVHVFDPHQPYDPPPPFDKLYEKEPYSGEVAYTDQQLGRLFDYLRSHGLMKDTLIVITADHGEGLGEHGENTHGYFAYNSTIHIPLIFYAQGRFKPHRVDTYVGHWDIFPTIARVIGEKPPSQVQGRSLLPALLGKRMEDEEIYFESLSPYFSRGWAPLRGIIKDRFKFIDLPIKEAYDLTKDFNEKHNVYGTPESKKLERELPRVIEKYSKGRVKAEAGAANINKLLSLGYVSGRVKVRSKFTAADDLKTLLPVHLKHLRAIKLYSGGDIEKAIKLEQEVIRARPDFPQAYITLATFYKTKGDIEKALKVFEEGEKRGIREYSFFTFYGMTLTEAGMPERAIKVLKKALSIMDFDPEAWNYLGIAYWKAGRFDDALKAYRRVLALDPDYASAYNNLGSLFLSMRIYDDAAKYFKKAMELDPTLAAAYNGLGDCYEAMGRRGEAIKLWKKALEKDPHYVLAIYNLAVALDKEGKLNEAKKYAKLYLKYLGEKIPLRDKLRMEAILKK